jgi:hypothetical protein
LFTFLIHSFILEYDHVDQDSLRRYRRVWGWHRRLLPRGLIAARHGRDVVVQLLQRRRALLQPATGMLLPRQDGSEVRLLRSRRWLLRFRGSLLPSGRQVIDRWQ